MNIRKGLLNRESITTMTIVLGVVLTSGLIIALPQYPKRMATEQLRRAQRQLGQKISDVLAERIEGLRLMADLYADGVIKKSADHAYYAQKLAVRAPGLKNISYYDERLILRNTYPPSPEPTANLAQSLPLYQLAQQAISTLAVVTSDPIAEQGQLHRVMVFVPVQTKQRRCLGLIVGALATEAIAQDLVKPLMDTKLPYQLEDQRGDILWAEDQEQLLKTEVVTLPVSIGGNRWQLRIPTAAMIGYTGIRLYDWVTIPFDWLTLLIGETIIMVVTFGTLALNRQGRQLEEKNRQIARLNQTIQSYAEHLEEEVAHRTGELRQAEQELRESYEQLKQTQKKLIEHERLSAIGRMSAVIAHEMRNPLAALCAAAEELKESAHLSGDQQVLLDIIASQVFRLNDIMSDTLSFTKPVVLEKTEADIHRVIDQVVTSLNGTGSRRTGVTISKRYAETVPKVFIDPDRTEQVLWNILRNALESLPEGRGSVEITTAWHPSGLNGIADACVEISVTDSGTGIAPEHLERIFEPFHTSKSQGTGLGLAIARQIVEAHGGLIKVESQVNQGTKMRVFLPNVTPDGVDVHKNQLKE